MPSAGFNWLHLSPLHHVLIRWGCEHLPVAIDAMIDKPEHEYVMRCLGALFRGAVKSDPPWLWQVIDADPKSLLAMAPYLGAVRWAECVEPYRSRFASLGWTEVPGKLSWREWIQSAAVAGELLAPCPSPLPQGEQQVK